MAKNKTIDKDLGYQELMGQVDIIDGSPSVEVGFFGGDNPERDGDGLTIAEYMAVNEKGTKDGRIPPRPVMGQTADTERQRMGVLSRRYLLQIATGKETVEGALTKMGIVYQGKLRKAIVAFDTPSNKMSTQIKKGGSPDRPVDNPLFDTGTAANSVTWEVDI